MFPEELPRRLIKMFSFVGDTVLDPFTGSGTTNLAAKNLGRNSIGIEVNPENIKKIQEKLNYSQNDIHGTTYEFVKVRKNIDFEEYIKKLPYIFTDPHKLDKKTDPKKLQFGSKIDSNGKNEREEYYSIKEIISPNKILLNNNLTVKLIGIKENPSLKNKAVEFLKEKTKGKKVFIKFDQTKFDTDNNMLCYLYLKNKTFLNAHLIKTGLVDVEKDFDFRFKDKFLRLLPHE